MSKKVQQWKGKFFSQAGKEILIKAVALAIPNYTMNVFRLPASLCHDLHSIIAWFGWGGDESKHKLHWWLWDRFCAPKECRGLGFRDLGIFNQAMLAKQCWILLQYPETLISHVLKAWYFPNTCFMQANLGNNPPFIWRSFL